MLLLSISRASQERHSLALSDSEPACTEGTEEEVGHEQVLWVDKYAPSHFTELLSDDVSTHSALQQCVDTHCMLMVEDHGT